jgi:hypothetical protein
MSSAERLDDRGRRVVPRLPTRGIEMVVIVRLFLLRFERFERCG